MSDDLKRVVILTGTTGAELAHKTAGNLGLQLGDAFVGRFSDGKVNVKIREDVRGKDIYVVQQDGPVPDDEIEIAEVIGASKRSAERVTLINPYCSSARGDRRDEPGKSIPAVVAARRLAITHVDRVAFFDLHVHQVASMYEAAGIDHVDDLIFRPVIFDELTKLDLTNAIVTPPDFGRLKVVRSYWKRLRNMGYTVGLGAIDKDGTASAGIEQFTVFGDFSGRIVHMFDDILSTGTTIIGAARAALEHGAIEVNAWISHAVLPSKSNPLARLEVCRALAHSPINKFYISDSLPLSKEEKEILGGKLIIYTISKLLALVIKRLHAPHSGNRLSSLFELDGYRTALAELKTTD